MNEKIKNLAAQAGAEFTAGFAGSPNFVSFAEEDFLWFAEMVVDKCASIAADKTNTDENACEIRTAIEKYFEVQK